MADIIIDTFIDSIKLVPFLFFAFLMLEFLEHKFNKKIEKVVINSKKYGPIIGGILGIFPQCGFSVLATNFYIMRIISLGTLISIYLSTSDEMLPILLSKKVSLIEIFKILGIKVIIGIFFGIIIDLILNKITKTKNKIDNLDYELCKKSSCGCEKNIIKSSIIHTLKTSFFLFIVIFVLNTLLSYIDDEIISKLFMKNSILSPFITSLIGLIPSCFSSIMITELYVSKIISFSSFISGLLTGSGVALLLLFKENKNKNDNFLILFLVYIIGGVSGILLEIINIFLNNI